MGLLDQLQQLLLPQGPPGFQPRQNHAVPPPAGAPQQPGLADRVANMLGPWQGWSDQNASAAMPPQQPMPLPGQPPGAPTGTMPLPGAQPMGFHPGRGAAPPPIPYWDSPQPPINHGMEQLPPGMMPPGWGPMRDRNPPQLTPEMQQRMQEMMQDMDQLQQLGPKSRTPGPIWRPR